MAVLTGGSQEFGVRAGFGFQVGSSFITTLLILRYGRPVSKGSEE